MWKVVVLVPFAFDDVGLANRSAQLDAVVLSPNIQRVIDVCIAEDLNNKVRVDAVQTVALGAICSTAYVKCLLLKKT